LKIINENPKCSKFMISEISIYVKKEKQYFPIDIEILIKK
jgi:hypothetical protein